ncbi:MAG TPA: ATP-binding protein [Gaiellaceae bacterium]
MRLPIATSLAVALAFVLLLLPAQGRNHLETAAAATLGLALVVLARRVRSTPLGSVPVCVGYVLFAALLRDAAAGSVSGFAALYLLPVIWLAWTAGGREVLIAFAAVLGALVAPLAIAASSYPANSGRASAILMVAVIAVAATIRLLRSETSQATSKLHEEAELLAQQNEGLRQLDRMKDEFIAIISHELRTPLSSITGYLELVLDDAHLLTRDHQEFLTVISRNVDRLTLLANDLLLLAAAENGTLALATSDFELSTLLEEAANAARPHAADQQIALRLEVEVDGQTQLHADRPRLAQLLDNLISNAIKFTPAGGSVTLRTLRGGDHVIVEVEDSGIGVAADELPRLFDRFYRARTATDGNVGGTGLGLAIAKTIADAHDAALEVTSELGGGTTFRLRLPPAALAVADAEPRVRSLAHR